MLLQFKVKNYKCFYDEAILDLTATQEKNHIDTTIDVNGNKILPVIEINGANASGKSSILEALMFMFDMIRLSNSFDVNQDLPIIPYAFSNKKKNSEFEISLLLDDYEYRYGFSVNKNEYEEEWLYKKKFSNSQKTKQKIVFERSNKKIEFGNEYKGYKKTWDLFSGNVPTSKLLVLSTIAIKEEKGILRSIYDYIYKSNFRLDNIFKNELSISILSKDDVLYDKFQRIINEFDPCLLGISVDEDESFSNNDKKHYKIRGIHKNIDNNEQMLIPLENESAGTIKMFNIIPLILMNLENGGLLCIDELDIKLHPLLFKMIVNMYKDRDMNKLNAQLIYTAHSTYLFNSDELRRDELYLVDKDSTGKSKLYSLSEFRNLRIDANYEKKYLSGEFGAIPYNK